MSPRAKGRADEEGTPRGHPTAEIDPETEPESDPPQQIEAVIGWRVRSRAREIGMSSAQFAKQVGFSRAMISKIENAQVSSSLATLSRLAEALEVPITSLFQGLDEERDALFTRSGGGPELGRPGDEERPPLPVAGVDAGTGQAHGADAGHADQQDGGLPPLSAPRNRIHLHARGRNGLRLRGSFVLSSRPGDSLQFDGEVAHGPVRLGRLPVRSPLGDRRTASPRRRTRLRRSADQLRAGLVPMIDARSIVRQCGQ